LSVETYHQRHPSIDGRILLHGTGFENTDWINLDQDRVQLKAFTQMEPNFWAGERDGFFLTSSATTGFSITLLNGVCQKTHWMNELIAEKILLYVKTVFQLQNDFPQLNVNQPLPWFHNC
jgi:hypothetical protein